MWFVAIPHRQLAAQRQRTRRHKESQTGPPRAAAAAARSPAALRLRPGTRRGSSPLSHTLGRNAPPITAGADGGLAPRHGCHRKSQVPSPLHQPPRAVDTRRCPRPQPPPRARRHAPKRAPPRRRPGGEHADRRGAPPPYVGRHAPHATGGQAELALGAADTGGGGGAGGSAEAHSPSRRPHVPVQGSELGKTPYPQRVRRWLGSRDCFRAAPGATVDRGQIATQSRCCQGAKEPRSQGAKEPRCRFA